MIEKHPGLQAAIKAATSATELARRLGISPQALSQWHQVPPLRVLDVERASGVSRYVLRPDLYGADAIRRTPSPIAENRP